MVKKLYYREIKRIVGPHPSAIFACKTMARRVGMGIAPEQLQKGVQIAKELQKVVQIAKECVSIGISKYMTKE